MEILSWNIQAAKGVDGITSVERIANDIKKLADADVICLQEVLVTATDNQVQQLSQYFPEHTVVFGAAVDRLDGTGRLQFGNLIMCRLPVLQIVNHKLPQPAEPDVRHMPRQAIEIIVDNAGSIIRIVTTHLDYFAKQQRAAQVAYLSAHHKQSIERFHHPSPEGGEGQFAALPETDLSIYCGDFNMPVDSQEYSDFCGASSEPDATTLFDGWRLLYNTTPHEPTCGIYDRQQWEEGPHCRDFFFVSSTLTNRVASFQVDTFTAASDHQPLVISIK